MTDGPGPERAIAPRRTEGSGRALGEAAATDLPPGVRVVIDVRSLQEPARAPRTAAYLDGLLSGFDADPLAGRVVRVPARVGRRRPDRRASSTSRSSAGGCCHRPGCCGQAALTVDPFVLRGASVGAAWRADRSGAAGAVYHAAGGALPIASACRSSSRSWTSRRGSCRARSSAERRRGSASGCVPGSSATPRRCIVGTEAVAQPAGGCCASGATGSTSSRWRRGPRTRPSSTRPRTSRRRPRRCRSTRTAGSLPRLLGRHDVRQDGDLVAALALLGSAGPSRRARRRQPTGRRGSSSWMPRPTIERRWPGSRPATAPATSSSTPRSCRPTTPRRSSRRPGRSSSPSCRRRAGSPRSMPSPRASRSSPPRWGPFRRSSARPGSSSSRATGTAGGGAVDRLERRAGPCRDRRGRRRARGEATRSWVDVASETSGRSTRGRRAVRRGARARNGTAGTALDPGAGLAAGTLPSLIVDLRSRGHDLDEGLADRQRDRLPSASKNRVGLVMPSCATCP